MQMRMATLTTVMERNSGRAREWHPRRGSLDSGTPHNIPVRYHAGAQVSQSLIQAAIAVVRGKADVLGPDGKTVKPITIVFCRLLIIRRDAGTPVQAIDVHPHNKNGSYILPWASERSPIISKTNCKLHEPCDTTDPNCEKCCNFPRKKKRK